MERSGGGHALVLYLAYDLFSFGGIQRLSRHQLRALGELLPGGEVHAGSLLGPRGRGLSGQVPVELVGGASLRARLSFALRFLRAARTLRPHLVVCDHLHLSPLGWAASRLAGARLCVNVYGIEAWGRLLPWRRAPLLRADRVVSVCRFTKERLAANYPELRERTIVVEDCVDVERFTPGPPDERLRSALGMPPGLVVLTVSRLAPGRSKGHDRVIEAMTRPELAEVPFVYLVVGDGDDRPRLGRRVRELGLERRVLFAGSVPDEELPRYYRLCDVFVLVSAFRLGRRREGEGMPLVSLEAQASGKPVVTSKLDGSAESIAEGETGLLVDPHDAAEVATALRRLLVDSGLRVEMGAAARRLAEERFSYAGFRDRLGRALPLKPRDAGLRADTSGDPLAAE